MWSGRQTWGFLMSYSNCQGSVSVSIHEPLTLGKKWKKGDFKKLPCQSESNSIVWKPGTGETQQCKRGGMSAVNLAYRPIFVCCEGNGITRNYSNLPRVAENDVATSGPGPVVIIFKSNKTINHGRNSRLFRISILMWVKPEARILVNAAQET